MNNSSPREWEQEGSREGGMEGADCASAEDMERCSCWDCGERTEGHKARAVEMNGKEREREHETVPRAFGVGEEGEKQDRSCARPPL